MRMVGFSCLAGILAINISAAHATDAHATDKYHVTQEERAACTDDAARLCSSAYPDEDKLLACMKINRGSLSSICLVAFDAGLKRRHL